MNDSGIDKTCHIPHGEAIVTPERLAKGDIAITNTAANGEALEIKLTIKNILNYLYEEDIITDQNWQDGFVLLIRKLSNQDLSAIEFALNTFATSHTKFIAQNRKSAYRGAFERLSGILPSVRDKIEALEALNEEDKNELSENNLKIMLASFKKGV